MNNRLQGFLKEKHSEGYVWAVKTDEGKYSFQDVNSEQRSGMLDGLRELFRTFDERKDSFSLLDVPRSAWLSLSREVLYSGALNSVLYLAHSSNRTERDLFPTLASLTASQLAPLDLNARVKLLLHWVGNAIAQSQNGDDRSIEFLEKVDMKSWCPEPARIVQALSSGHDFSEFKSTTDEMVSRTFSILTRLGLTADQYLSCSLSRYAEWEADVQSAIVRRATAVIEHGALSGVEYGGLLSTSVLEGNPDLHPLFVCEAPKEFLCAQTYAHFLSRNSADIGDATLGALLECLNVASSNAHEFQELVEGLPMQYAFRRFGFHCLSTVSPDFSMPSNEGGGNLFKLAFESAWRAFLPQSIDTTLQRMVSIADSERNREFKRQIDKSAEDVIRAMAKALGERVREIYGTHSFEMPKLGKSAIYLLSQPAHVFWLQPVIEAVIASMNPAQRRRLVRESANGMSF